MLLFTLVAALVVAFADAPVVAGTLVPEVTVTTVSGIDEGVAATAAVVTGVEALDGATDDALEEEMEEEELCDELDGVLDEAVELLPPVKMLSTRLVTPPKSPPDGWPAALVAVWAGSIELAVGVLRAVPCWFGSAPAPTIAAGTVRGRVGAAPTLAMGDTAARFRMRRAWLLLWLWVPSTRRADRERRTKKNVDS